MFTGCSSSFLTDLNRDIIQACESTTGDRCLTGLAKGYSVFGIPVRHATLDQARLQGGVDKVFGVENVTSYGLITVTRLTVYGS